MPCDELPLLVLAVPDAAPDDVPGVVPAAFPAAAPVVLRDEGVLGEACVFCGEQ